MTNKITAEDATMNNPNQIVNENGLLRSVYGPDANEAFMLRTLVLSLELELKGIRLSKAVSALTLAKGVTGLKSNERKEQIACIKEMMQKALEKCDVINIVDSNDKAKRGRR